MEQLSTWVIYDHPNDYPHHFVVRQWLDGTPSPVAAFFPDVESARDMVSMGRTCIPRDPDDDPAIVECWI